MITERHNVACRLIMKAISEGSLAGCIVHMDAGSTDCFAQQNLQILSTLVIGLYDFTHLDFSCSFIVYQRQAYFQSP